MLYWTLPSSLKNILIILCYAFPKCQREVFLKKKMFTQIAIDFPIASQFRSLVIITLLDGFVRAPCFNSKLEIHTQKPKTLFCGLLKIFLCVHRALIYRSSSHTDTHNAYHLKLLMTSWRSCSLSKRIEVKSSENSKKEEV